MLATLEMDFTVVVYTEERTNRFLRVLARSNMAAAAQEDGSGQAMKKKRADMIGSLKWANSYLRIRNNAIISAAQSVFFCGIMLDLNDSSSVKCWGK